MKRWIAWIIGLLAVVAVGILGADAVYQWRDRAYLRDLGTTAKPDANGQYDMVQLGYNTPKVSPRKPPGSYRILVIGDSFMHGITTADYTPPAFLQRRLAALFPGRIVEVVNLGVPSISFPEYMANYNFWSRRLEHDAVIFSIFTGNDFTDPGVSVPHSILGDAMADANDVMVSVLSLNRRQHQFAMPLYHDIYAYFGPAVIPYSQGTPLPPDSRYTTQGQFDQPSYLRIMEIAARPYRTDLLPSLTRGYGWANRLLQRAGAIAASGKKVLVAIAPSHAVEWQNRVLQAYPHGGLIDPLLPGKQLAELHRAGGWAYPLLDLTPGMQSAEEAGVQTFRGLDSHWSVEGNKAAAELLAIALNDWLSK